MSGTYPASPEASRINITSLNLNLMSESLSGRRQVRGIGSQRWAITASYNPMTRAEFAPVYTFIIKQRGMFESFQFVPPVVAVQSGTASGSKKVNGALSIGATSMNLQGGSGTLKAGDFFKFANHSKVYMFTADRNGNGNVTFEPPLIATVADDEGLVITNVPFTVRLNNDVQQYSLVGYERYIYEVDMVEAI